MMYFFTADHFPIPQISNYNGEKDYDHVVLLISKTPQLREYLLQINIVEISRSLGKKVWFIKNRHLGFIRLWDYNIK